MSLKLYCNKFSFRGLKILVAAELAQVNVQLVEPDLHDKTQLQKVPTKKYPILETDSGCLFESNAIIRYIGRLGEAKGLYGANVFERAQIDQWCDYSNTELDANVHILLYSIYGIHPCDEETYKKAKEELFTQFTILNNHLDKKNHFVGNTTTIADITISSLLNGVFRAILDEATRNKFPNLTNWFSHITSGNAFQKFFGKTRLCQQELAPQVQAVQKKEEKKADEKVEKKPKEDSKADEKKKGKETNKQAKKETEKPKPKPKKEQSDSDEEPVQKKKEDPLTKLPPSTFILDDFKRDFVNAVDKKASLETFFKNWDAAGWSAWNVKYINYGDDGEKLLPFRNKHHIFLQKCDEVRKWAFGSFGIYGEEPALELKGIWFWRSTEIIQQIKDLDSYEYHTWDKLDFVNNPEHKQMLCDYWLNVIDDEKCDDQNPQSIVQGQRARLVKYLK